LAELIGKGRLTAPVGLERSWRDPGSAMEALRDRQVKGKAVLSVD
jgi:hypothetical protein